MIRALTANINILVRNNRQNVPKKLLEIETVGSRLENDEYVNICLLNVEYSG